jgi:hypothetical protein
MIAAADMRQAASDHAVMEPAPIVKAFGWTNAQTAFVIAISYLFGTITMILGVALRRHPRTRRHVGPCWWPAAADSACALRLQLHRRARDDDEPLSMCLLCRIGIMSIDVTLLILLIVLKAEVLRICL